MPRRIRIASGGYAYHVLNRAVGRTRIFGKQRDFEALEEVIGRWSSLWHRVHGDEAGPLDDGPLPLPRRWRHNMQRPHTEAELESLRRSVVRGASFGRRLGRIARRRNWACNRRSALAAGRGRQSPRHNKEQRLPTPLFCNYRRTAKSLAEDDQSVESSMAAGTSAAEATTVHILRWRSSINRPLTAFSSWAMSGS